MRRGQGAWLFLTVCSTSLLVCVEVRADGVRMRLELELDRATCRVFENFALKVRIVNPNPFPVILPGFELGYIEPEIHVLGSDGVYHRVYYGAMDSAWTRTPIVVAAGGAMVRHRFLYNYFSHERWPNEPGAFTLRANTHISSCQLAAGGDHISIEWDYPVVIMSVDAQSHEDRQGMEFLQQQFTEYREAVRKGDAEPANVFRVRLFREFLGRFGNSTYSPEIRWELARLLESELGNKGIAKVELPAMQELFKDSLKSCLDRGGAYAEEFLRWDSDRGGSSVMELAIQIGNPELLRALSDAVDRKYPQDEPGALLRRVVVEGVTGDMDKAHAAADELANRFPDGKYIASARQLLRELERKHPVKEETP